MGARNTVLLTLAYQRDEFSDTFPKYGSIVLISGDAEAHDDQAVSQKSSRITKERPYEPSGNGQKPV
jgi:hypothetical protein